MSYEILGVIASLLVLISFSMRKAKDIRMINILGAIIFVIYGLLINAFSVWFLNGILVFIHIYYLSKEK